MESIIKNLDNELYHNGDEYYEYWSSTGLRNYLKSPAEAKRIHDEHEHVESTPQLILGSLVHDALEYVHDTGDFSLSKWEENMAVFDAPINPSTGVAYGAATKKYIDAYNAFLETVGEKQIVSKQNLDTAHAIARSIERDNFMNKVVVRGEAEVSHFLEYEGAKLKTRPDLELNHSIFDWKTFGDSLSKDKLLRRIIDGMYHVQAAMYQWMTFMQTGEWKPFYICFIQTAEPYGICVASLNGLAYTVVDGIMVNDQTCGARQFEILRDLHCRCTSENYWPGHDIFVKPDEGGRRIIEFDVPAWVNNNVIEPYFE